MSDTIETERAADDALITAAKHAKPQRALFAEAVTINRPSMQLYEFWRDPANLASFMDNIEAIEPIDALRSRWRVKAPVGRTVEWESIVTDDQYGTSITWQSADGADVANSGKVEFLDAGERGTVVRAVIAYDPPAGVIGQLVAKLFQREPRLQTRRDLRRFKQLMETGEIATSARNRSLRDGKEG